MAKFANSVLFTPTLGGTTDWTVNAAVQGYMTPAQAGAPDGVYKYRAESSDLSQWEVGEGTYTGSGPTLTRTTVLQNSSGTTSKINFSTVPNVGVVALKQDLLSIEDANLWTYIQQAQARANIGALKKNYIVNGGMQVSQENGSTAGTVSGYFPADQFGAFFNNAGTVSVAQVASQTPGGSPNRLRVTVTAADASVGAGDYSRIEQPIEGLRVADLFFGLATAKQIVIQFGVKAPSGTYCVAVRNAAATRSYIGEYTISGGEANTDTVKTVTLTGDTTGTWAKDTTVGAYISWTLMAGTTYQQSAASWATSNTLGSSNQFNFMGTNGNVFELFDVGLYEGTVAPAFQLPDFASEFVLCQRYWEKSYDYATAPGSVTFAGNEGFFTTGLANAANQLGWAFRYKMRKRAVPTLSIYSPNTGTAARVFDSAASADVTCVVDMTGETGSRVYSTGSGAFTAGARYFHWTANARM